MTLLQLVLLASIITLPGDAGADGPASRSADGAYIAPVAPGPFQGTVTSLQQYKCPDWFRDAKFGIWAHWGPQSVGEDGDWYARHMYEQGSRDYNDHLAQYGPPSKVGYKDLVNLWTASKWDPVALMALYKKAGAHYFVGQAVHHDNFDLWDSKFHSFNAVKMGPHRDVVGEWAQAARAQGLPFGLSEHLGHAYQFFQAAHGADATGPLAGVPYDGADLRWQELYAPLALPGDHGWYPRQPEVEEDWQRRMRDVVETYHPDLFYSDGGLPFDALGRAFLANYYNTNLAANHGTLTAVYTCKNSSGEYDPGTCIPDSERGNRADISPEPWQSETSNGDWFYDKNDHYKSTGTVLRLLSDVVSKNGCYLVNVVLKPDGTLPPESRALLDGLAAWMPVNGEAIFGTRPWKVFGEGPTVMKTASFNENFDFKADDIRFTTRNGDIYALCLGVPTSEVRIKSLGAKSPYATAPVKHVALLGASEKVAWKQQDDALVIEPATTWPSQDVVVYKIGF